MDMGHNIDRNGARSRVVGSRVSAFIGGALRSVCFVLLASAIVVVGSERMFWYWETNPLTHVELTAFYAVPTTIALWTIGHYHVRLLWPFALVAPLIAYVVEGAITPVLYSGGPFVPFFPLWFTAWHGLLAAGVLLIIVRRLLTDDRQRELMLVSLALGAFWGTWAMTLTLPESRPDADLIEDLGHAPRVLSGIEFSTYACTFGVILIACHWLIGFVWPAQFSIPRWVRVVGVIVTLGAVAAWTFVAPWAMPMFAVYAGIQPHALRRYARTTSSGESMLGELTGHVRPRALLPLVLLPATASLVYASWVSADPAEEVVRVVLFTIIAAQTMIAAVVTVGALVRVMRGHDPPLTPRGSTDLAAVQ